MTTLLLVGGSSDIGTAIVSRLAAGQPGRAVLVGRPSARRDHAVQRLTAQGVEVEAVDADCTDLSDFVRVLARVLDQHEIDIAVVAQGVLPDQVLLESEPARALDVAAVNYTSAMAAGLLLARHMSARNGRRGAIVALSSVAAVRPRVSNYVYGSTKAGLDAFFRGLGERLTHSGVRVLVVRPGFVVSAMTAGRAPAPFATTPEAVAEAVSGALARSRPTRSATVLWVPRPLAAVGRLLGVLPSAVLRRLPEERPSRPSRRARSEVSTPSGSSR